jgi:hypothetical protein
VCVTPSGPMLIDDVGQPVWVRTVRQATTNLRVQSLAGQPVLTWWQGVVADYGVGTSGEYVILDGSYRQVMAVRAQNGLQADLHEFLIAPNGIAYFTAYRRYTTDLRSVDGPAHGSALDATIQGVDLSTGDLVFDWSSAAHIDFAESHQQYSKQLPYDPVHLNSIDLTPDGKLLVSARNTWTIYKIDPANGDIVWRLGGKKSDFGLGPGVRFAWQHDARSHADGTISLFDDQSAPPESKQSRGLLLTVDETAKTALVNRQYFHPNKALLAGSQGSVQVLPDGNILIGWGAQPYFTELRTDGTLVLDGKLATGDSYRALRFDWTGTPTDLPVLALDRAPSSRIVAYVSWNGSTETVRWRLLAGSSAEQLGPVAEEKREGFETTIVLPRSSAGTSYVAVAAIDAAGAVLARSKPVAVTV